MGSPLVSAGFGDPAIPRRRSLATYPVMPERTGTDQIQVSQAEARKGPRVIKFPGVG